MRVPSKAAALYYGFSKALKSLSKLSIPRSKMPIVRCDAFDVKKTMSTELLD